MVYPLLSQPTSVVLYERGFSAFFDLVWSFDYYLENITSDTEFGFVMFLQQDLPEMKGGGYGIGLNYTAGLSTNETQTSIISGLSGAILGIGFDSTGCFALSSEYNNRIIRDGVSEINRIPNSVSLRDKYPATSFNKHNTYYELSGFSIVDASKKTIRARLGNLGRTIYVDYRRNPNDDFINILTKDVDLSLNLYNFIRPGITFCKPISSNYSPQATAIIDNFHVEGGTYIPELDPGTEFTVITGLSTDDLPVDPEDPGNPLDNPRPPDPPQRINLPDQLDYAKVESIINRGEITSVINDVPNQQYDVYNFGYSVFVSGFNIVLNRTGTFIYSDNNRTLYKSSENDNWKLSIPPLNTLVGPYGSPIGTYQSQTHTSTTTYYNV